jgi:2-oxoglutarate ferredoxin oxidoreductase subunit delta
VQVRANQAYCKGCNLCVLVCPRRVFEKGADIGPRGYVCPVIAHPEKCPNFNRREVKNAVCEMCILTCPDQALEWDAKEEAK